MYWNMERRFHGKVNLDFFLLQQKILYAFYYHFTVNHTITYWNSYLIDRFLFFGHDCGIYVVKYVEYMLPNDIGSMSIKFNVGRAWLDIASLLFRYQKMRKATRKVQQTGGSSIVIE